MDWWTGEKPDRKQTGQRKDFSYTNIMQLIIIYVYVYIHAYTKGAITKNVQNNDLPYVRLYWSLRLNKKMMIIKNVIIQIIWKLNTAGFLSADRRET